MDPTKAYCNILLASQISPWVSILNVPLSKENNSTQTFLKPFSLEYENFHVLTFSYPLVMFIQQLHAYFSPVIDSGDLNFCRGYSTARNYDKFYRTVRYMAFECVPMFTMLFNQWFYTLYTFFNFSNPQVTSLELKHKK